MGLFLIFYFSIGKLSTPNNDQQNKSHDGSSISGRKKKVEVTDKYGNKYTIHGKYYRKVRSFVEGFLIKDQGVIKNDEKNTILFLESSGLYGSSFIQTFKLDKENMEVKVIKKTNFDQEYFSEGIDFFEDNEGKELIYTLSYLKRDIFKFDAKTLTPLEKNTNNLIIPMELKEGWGMTHDPKDKNIAIISDSSDKIYYCDTKDKFTIKKVLSVKEVAKEVESIQRAVKDVNEMEVIDDYLWGNIYLSNDVVKID